MAYTVSTVPTPHGHGNGMNEKLLEVRPRASRDLDWSTKSPWLPSLLPGYPGTGSLRAWSGSGLVWISRASANNPHAHAACERICEINTKLTSEIEMSLSKDRDDMP